MLCDLTKKISENDHMYNYRFALRSILNISYISSHPCLVQYLTHIHFFYYVERTNSIYVTHVSQHDSWSTHW